MTLEEALKLPAGRELNALVVEQVMGWKPGNENSHWLDENNRFRSAHFHRFSTDIAAAWEVVEKIRKNTGGWFELIRSRETWNVKFGEWDEFGYVFGVGETAPLAICRAALKACWKESQRNTG